MALEIILACAVVILLLVFIVKSQHLDQLLISSGSFPKVQPCLPFFGNALQLDIGRCHLAFSELRQKYGPVFSIQMYKENIVVLNDFESIHDALIVKGSDFAGRPFMYRTSQAARNKHSIVWQTYTQKLVFLRKSVLKCLRMYGTGLGKLEDRCAPDILRMCQRLTATNGKAFDPWNIVYDSVCSIMLNLIFGTRFEYTSQSFHSIREINALFNDTFGSGRARRLDFVPLLWLFRDDSYCRMHKALRMRDEFWEKQLLKMKEACNVDPDCIVQNLLDQVNDNAKSATAAKTVPSSTTVSGNSRQQGWKPSDLSETTVKEVFTNLILAGTDTTATALTCFLLILLHYPCIQKQLQQEVDQVVGKERAPTLADRAFLPHVEAVLMELLRYISHVPLAVPHYTICDTTVLDKPVPANTTVYINLWALHHSEDEWTDPWQFDPSRFLDDQGKLVPPSHINRRKLLPFGAGRRVCLGEILAKNRLFLFATALVQKFHFEAEDRDSLPEVDPRTYEMGLVLHPKPFKLCAIPRNLPDSVS